MTITPLSVILIVLTIIFAFALKSDLWFIPISVAAINEVGRVAARYNAPASPGGPVPVGPTVRYEDQ